MSKLIGNRIKLFRNKKDIAREDFATHLGVSIHTLIKYEQGQREPNIETLKKIATALDISIETLTSSESFDREVLDRAIQIAMKDLPKDEDVFMLLGWYADYDSLTSFYVGSSSYLPYSCIKGLLEFIAERSKDEFNKIYKDLIETDVYNLDSELEDYCQKLYINTMNPLQFISKDDIELLESLGYVKDGRLDSSIDLNIKDGGISSIKNGNRNILPPVSFEEMKSKVDSAFPALDAEIKFLSDPNVEKVFNYSFNELALQGGYQELLIIAVEKAIKDTLYDIKMHLEAGDIFDGVSSWITKESPVYEILKKHKNL